MRFVVESKRNRRRRRLWPPRAACATLWCLAAVVLVCAPRAYSVPACPEPALLRQPDGTAFLGRRVGDERWNFTETVEGYTIVQDASSGFWFFAVEKNGLLEKSDLPVGKTSPKSVPLKKHLRPTRQSGEGKSLMADGDGGVEAYLEATQPRPSLPAPPVPTPAPPPLIKHLVILARFPEHVIYVSRDELDNLFNEPGYSEEGASGSVRDYYLDVSANQLTIDSTVAEWVSLPRSESFYGGNDGSGNDSSPWQLVRDAVQMLDKVGFDFSPFDGDGDGYVDMLTVIHSGLGEEYAANPSNCVWSQVVNIMPSEVVDGVRVSRAAIAPERRYDTTSITRIGVVCHEMGHLLGLPDLYDTDGSSAGIGNWGIMGGGSWGGDGYSAESPVHFCCWSKVNLGWIEPTEIDVSSSPVTVPGIEKAGSWGVYKVSCEMADGEYLLIENRRKTGYDLRLPGDGLLIWHVDESQPWNSDESHYMVGLLQADGDEDLEEGRNRGDAGDPFPGSSNTRFIDETTSPGTASYYNGATHIAISDISDSTAMMSFEISTLSDIYSEDFSGGLPADWEIVDGFNDGYTWTDQNPGERSHESWSGKFAIVDSDAAGWHSMDEKLVSPEIDCSLYVHTRFQFSHYFRASGEQTGDVDLRVDGGKWQNVARYKLYDYSGTESIDISSLADGRSSVQVRWRFYNISYGWYWGIDDFAIRGELPDNSPPHIAITGISQRRDGSGRIEIQFIGSDPENDPASWATAYCQCALSPYTLWVQLNFDTADPANTAIEPMPFTAKGRSFVAVVDASAWDGLFKVKLRVTDGVTSEPAVISDEFFVDNTPAAGAMPTHLEENPLSGDTSVTARATWIDSNPGITWFLVRLNGGVWSPALQGNPSGGVSQAATLASLFLDGDDYLTAKSYHVDDFGNRSEESISYDYYVTPLAPASPSVGDATPHSLTIVLQPNPSEQGEVDYAVYCPTEDKYVDWGTGGLVEVPGWGNLAQWRGETGIAVVGLKSKTSYAFQVTAANPHSHDWQSEPSPLGSAATTNSPPNRPTALLISPEHPTTIDELVCVVTPAPEADADPEDVVTYRYTWSCSGKAPIVHGPIEALSDTLASQWTARGDTWDCTVEPYDGTDYGPAVAGQVTVLNTPPTIEVLGQRGAYAGQSIHLDIVSSDADGDPTNITCPGMPPDATFNENGDGTATFLWSGPSEEIRYEIIFSVTDGSDQMVESAWLTFSQMPFEIASVTETVERGGEKVLVITWSGLPGVVYSIERSQELLSWESVALGISLPQDSIAPGWLTYQEEAGESLPSPRYYRVGM